MLSRAGAHEIGAHGWTQLPPLARLRPGNASCTECVDTLFAEYAWFLNASNPSDEARMICIPPEFHQRLMSGANSLVGWYRQEFDVTRKVRDIQF